MTDEAPSLKSALGQNVPLTAMLGRNTEKLETHNLQEFMAIKEYSARLTAHPS